MTAWPRGALRFLRYNLVGVLGLSVKFGVLIALSEIAHLNYLWATALAVEAAVLHNFTWHIRWTWRDRSAGLPLREVLLRLLRFHLANGAVGMVVNLLMMWLLVERTGMHYLSIQRGCDGDRGNSQLPALRVLRVRHTANAGVLACTSRLPTTVRSPLP